MVVGICSIELHIGEVFSLKDKRRVIKSLIGRLSSKYNIAVAETGKQDVWSSCELGVACVSNKASHADSMMSNVINYIESDLRVELVDYTTEVVHYEL